MKPEVVQKYGLDPIRSVNVRGHDIQFAARGNSAWRFNTLLTKEPETIDWIDGFSEGDTLWDVGANVGIYTIYAALRGIRVVAFEPNFSNYFVLCVNVALNGLQDVVTPLCLALSDSKAIGTINLRNLDIGASGASFSPSGPEDTKQLGGVVFRQGMVGYDIDSLVRDFNIGIPSHIKIDVDGIEPQIIKGATRTLADPALKSVSVELDDRNTGEVDYVTSALQAADLKFVHKKNNPQFNIEYNIKGFDSTMNFLFSRSLTN